MEDLKNNPGLGQFLKDVLASGKSIDTLESNTALNSCYKKGWLQAELVPYRTEDGPRVQVDFVMEFTNCLLQISILTIASVLEEYLTIDDEILDFKKTSSVD
jgi:hypothetical protein